MGYRNLILTGAALALAAAAQVGAQTPPAAMSVLPPPAMDDPGVETAPAREMPALPSMQDSAPVPPPTSPPPTVNVREQDGDIIQEYVRNGVVYMIRIVPEHGVTQTFIDTDGDGLLNRDSALGPVSPVYYTIYEWD